MFTGIVEEVGRIARVQKSNSNSNSEGSLFTVECSFAPSLKVGDSLSLNGVCQTVVAVDREASAANVFATSKTLRQTTLKNFQPQQAVNLERALKANARIDGHFVYGHVDATRAVYRLEERKDHSIIGVGLKPSERRFVVPKGSIAVDGVALTVQDLSDDGFEVMVVPHTLDSTVLRFLREGDEVNLEFDVLVKAALNHFATGPPFRNVP